VPGPVDDAHAAATQFPPALHNVLQGRRKVMVKNEFASRNV
jgi:hypothetical protein